jgi:hypothetical protein
VCAGRATSARGWPPPAPPWHLELARCAGHARSSAYPGSWCRLDEACPARRARPRPAGTPATGPPLGIGEDGALLDSASPTASHSHGATDRAALAGSLPARSSTSFVARSGGLITQRGRYTAVARRARCGCVARPRPVQFRGDIFVSRWSSSR